jgi:tRNA(Ile)-lysidine synthase
MPRREKSFGGETIYMEVAMIRAKVRDWVKRHGLLPQGENILAACSGGPDSLALVDLLAEFHQVGDIRLFVAHFNHCLRGDASSQDADFVRRFCAERSLDFFSGSADLPALLRVQGGSLEELARSMRYRFLREVAARIGGALIATGHHRDDQAETVLLNLIRGSGSRGLAAMQPFRGDVVRPLLCLDRSEIEAYCGQRDLRPRTDESNADVDFLRNRLRHELLPVLKNRYNPAVVDTLCRTASILTDEQDFLRCQASEVLPRVVTWFEWGCRIDAEAFCRMHVAMQRELLRQLLEQLRGDARGLGFVHIEQIRQLFLREHGGRRISMPGMWQARKNYQELIIEKLESDSMKNGASAEVQPSPPVLLECPGETLVPEFGAIIRCARLPAGGLTTDVSGPCKAVFDCSALQFPLYVRRRLPGDVFFPLGAPGSRKLKKMLIDLKVPAEKRERLPLICDEKGILWVAGLRRSERGKVDETSRDLLVLELTTIENT